MADTERTPAYCEPRLWLLSLGVGVVIGSFNAASRVVDILSSGSSTALWKPVLWELSSSLCFVLLVPFVVEFALTWRFRTRPAAQVVVAHVGALVLFSLAHVGGMVAIRKLVYYAVLAGRYDFGNVPLELLYEGLKDSITYVLLIGLIYGFDYFRRFRQTELDASRLETELVVARLDNLEHHLQPHFLFNSLNMISALMHEDVDRADRMISKLSDLLRLSVQRAGTQLVTVADEVQVLEAYLEIMKARFEDRLLVELQIGPHCNEAMIPSFLLQPLVENAVKHGIAESSSGNRGSGGRIEVEIGRDGSRLRVRVADDGDGCPSPEIVEGFGLSSTRQRLETLYGDDHELRIEHPPGGGLAVEISVPWRLK